MAAGPPASLTPSTLKVLSLVTLTLQNSLLTILLHYSRTRGAAYSAATAVLLNELLKGSISFAVAYRNTQTEQTFTSHAVPSSASGTSSPSMGMSRIRKPLGEHSMGSNGSNNALDGWRPATNGNDAGRRLDKLRREILSPDCWKLSIPAILYVIQNNLQFVAASNLDVATFQVSYQLKILTTALFSVLLLKRRLTAVRWTALFFLALGVGIVQLQSTATTSTTPAHGSDHVMNPVTGFLAVAMACMTSGLAGVYFEMVLKGSTADLWVRNVQLSLFSLIPALLPALSPMFTTGRGLPALLDGFGVWAWATVWCQVIGGLVTALVIKYSDNIVKGFATSLSIVLSFLAGVVLFAFPITLSFLVGASVVLGATYLYNSPSAVATAPTTNGGGNSAPMQILNAQQQEPLLPGPGSRPTSPPMVGRSSSRTGSVDATFVSMPVGGDGLDKVDRRYPP